MTNKIKHSQAPPATWSKMWVRTIRKKNSSINDLNSYRSVFIGSIASLIFEKLLNLRIISYLEQNMAKFQTGGIRGKDVTDNLFILRGSLVTLIIWAKSYGFPSVILKSVLTVDGLDCTNSS